MAGTIGLAVIPFATSFIVREASAHVVLPRLEATRRITIALGEPSMLEYAIALGPKQAFLARQIADVDHDGAVDASEGAAFVERWTRTIGERVTIGLHAIGTPATTSLRAKLATWKVVTATSVALVGPIGETGDDTTAPLTVRCSWSLPLGDDTDRIAIEDAVELAPFEHTELEVHDSPSRRFVGIGADEQHLSSSPHLAFVDDGSPSARLVSIVFQPAPRRSFPWRIAALAAAGLVVLVIVGSRVRRGAR